MKVFKMIMLILSNILTIPLAAVMTCGAIWYTLPNFALTKVGLFISSHLSGTVIFWITISAAVTFLLLLILQKIFDKTVGARFKNFFIHLNSWLIALLAIVLSVYTFVTINPLVANELVISVPRKISIGVIIGILVLYHIFSTKILTIINRRIQSYEVAKETNTIGRSSVIFVNLLKLLEVFFPEMIILGLLCFCVSWSIASYFIVILVACLIPMFGNMSCDFNIRTEIRIKKEIEKDMMAQKVASHIKEGK